MATTCDNKSVGVIIRKGGKFALVKRINFPVAYAFIAGHIDGENPEVQAKNEALEEGGITVTKLKKVLHESFKNPCKRDGGLGHDWIVFEATEWHGELKAGSDAKKASWESIEKIRRLARRSDSFLIKHGFTPHHFDLAKATRIIAIDPTWEKSPGLELVWLVMLRRIDII